MNFNIGDEVVCVKNHSCGIVLKGKIYIIFQIGQCICGNSLLMVTSPECPSPTGNTHCTNCERTIIGSPWLASKLFRKIQNQFAHKEILKEFKTQEEKLDGKEKVIN